MIVDLPSSSTGEVVKRLIALRNEVGAMAMGRVLTLVVSVDEAHADEAIRTANDATRQHPARIVVLVSGNARGAGRLDAQIRVGGDAGASEVVVLRLYGGLVRQEAAVLTPLLLPDSPVVAWWPCGAPSDVASTPLGQIAARRITDTCCAERASSELRRRASHYVPGDTDLAWTRLTRWRALLASSLEGAPYECVTAATVTAEPNLPGANLLAGWLAHALQCPVTRVRSAAGTGLVSVRMERGSGPIDLVRSEDGADTATLSQPLQPARLVALHTPGPAATLADELRRLDPDEIYAAALLEGLPLVRSGSSRTEAVRAGKAPAGVAELPDVPDPKVGSASLRARRPQDGPVDDARLAARVEKALSSPSAPVVREHTSKAEVAAAVTDELVRRVEAAVAHRGVAHVALTGGSMGNAVMAALADRSTDLDGAIWSSVHLWWGDERFVPAGDADRNDTQADEVGLTDLPVVERHVHRVPAPRPGSEVTADAVRAAAATYAAELATWAPAATGADGHVPVPPFDVVMLGVGPDAHVASLFPDRRELTLVNQVTAAVLQSPKPPPARVTLTLPALSAADAVWLMAAGAEKAEAVGRATAARDDRELPASCVHGRVETVWWVDSAARGS